MTTLLMMETRRVDQVFAEHWLAWQRRERLALRPEPRIAAALFDHFPFLLYEYFATVPMGTARRVALAARAGGMAHRLRHLASRGGCEPATAEYACRWLRAFATEQLSSDLPPQSPYWQSMAAGHRRLRDAFTSDDLTVEPSERLSRRIADTTALAHSTSEAFAGLAGRPTPLLTDSQTHLYTGLTLYQNCVTWRVDFLQGYPSHVVPLLLEELGSRRAAPRVALVTDAARCFYYGGLAQRTLEDAAEHLCRAIAAVTDLPPSAWVQALAGFLQKVRRLRADIARIRVANAHHVTTRHGAGPTPPQIATADTAAATRYLRNEQAPAGYWGDFLLLGQQSTAWVTGYVGWNLALGGATGATQVNLDAAADWLTTHEQPGGGWGYNDHWPVDVDSTANGLLFLTTWRANERDRWTPLLAFLLSTQRPDGGFATIIDPSPWLLRFQSQAADLRGWTSPHPCVTAVVALLLAGLDGERETHAAVRAMSYLQACQRPEGYWDAYWWMGRLYTTCRAMQAVCELRHRVDLPTATSALERATDWLVDSQHADGGWASVPAGRSRVFPTALAVQALCAARNDEIVGSAVARGARWLAQHQLPDGSWPSSPILRVPRPDVLSPWEQPSWTESIVGLDVVVDDWRRLFTTATALRAVHAASPTGDVASPLLTGGTR